MIKWLLLGMAILLCLLLTTQAYAIDRDIDFFNGIDGDEKETLGIILFLVGAAILLWLAMTSGLGPGILYVLLFFASFMLFGIFGPLFVLFLPFGFRLMRNGGGPSSHSGPCASSSSRRRSSSQSHLKPSRTREIHIPIPVPRFEIRRDKPSDVTPRSDNSRGKAPSSHKNRY